MPRPSRNTKLPTPTTHVVEIYRKPGHWTYKVDGQDSFNISITRWGARWAARRHCRSLHTKPERWIWTMERDGD